MSDIKDTSDMLDDNDLKLMNDINKVKKRILSYFKMEAIIQKIKDEINTSDVLEFSNKRSEKFISVNKPVFIIHLKNKECSEKYKHKKFINEKEEIEWISNSIYTEIISPYSTFILDAISNNPDLNMDLNSIFKENMEIVEIGSLIFSSVFGMRIDKEKYIIHLEYMI